MIQSGGFLGNLLGKLAGPLMKAAMPLAKNVLAPLGLSVLCLQLMEVLKKDAWFRGDQRCRNNNLNNFK